VRTLAVVTAAHPYPPVGTIAIETAGGQLSKALSFSGNIHARSVLEILVSPCAPRGSDDSAKRPSFVERTA
jgi:hypothetical protein